MGFQDAALMPKGTSFSSAFRKNCNKGECLGATICPKTVVRDKQGHAPCKIPKP